MCYLFFLSNQFRQPPVVATRCGWNILPLIHELPHDEEASPPISQFGLLRLRYLEGIERRAVFIQIQLYLAWQQSDLPLASRGHEAIGCCVVIAPRRPLPPWGN